MAKYDNCEVQSQLLSYFIKHDQFAFLKNQSTVTCLHKIIDNSYDAKMGEYIISCFLDVQICFDSINHDILTKSSLCMAYKVPNLLSLRIIWRTANNSYLLTAKHRLHKWSRPVYPKAQYLGHSYFSSTLMIYQSLLWMRIAIYLQMTVLYIYNG